MKFFFFSFVHFDTYLSVELSGHISSVHLKKKKKKNLDNYCELMVRLIRIKKIINFCFIRDEEQYSIFLTA